MNGPLQIIDPLHYPRWDELLLRHPEHSFFHCSSWARVLQQSYRYRPLYITRIDQGKLSVLVPFMEVDSALTGKRGVSLPFSDYCEPILPETRNWTEIMNVLVAYGKQRGWRSIEVRGGKKRSEQWPCSSFYFRHTLDLVQGEAALFSGLADSTRRNIRKAVRQGVAVTITRSEDAMEEFYRLNCITRKEHGLPSQPYRFFKALHEHAVAPGHAFVALARHGSASIAGAVFFCFGDEVLFKYGASERTYQHLRANNLVLWEAIRWSVRSGYKHLCFGRTEPGNAGLRRFKAGWGAEEHILKYYQYDIRKKAFVDGSSIKRSFYSEIFKIMPVPLLKLAGKALYRHVG